MTNYKSQIPANARAGQFARFSATGRFLRLEDRMTNGLGLAFEIKQGGELVRVFF